MTAALSGKEIADKLEKQFPGSIIESSQESLVVKTRCYERDNPTLSSMVSLWRGADFQEREIYDLMGISFDGHPNLKRLFLWQGFKGHPLRKDYR